MTLTRDHIARSLHSRLDLSKFESTCYLESALEIIRRTLAGGDDVLISGFGKFSVRKRGARRGRDPATDEHLTLTAHRVVTFRCSPVLRENLNGNEDLVT